jgi:hypothetical protein
MFGSGGGPYDPSAGLAFVARTDFVPVFSVATPAAARIRDPSTSVISIKGRITIPPPPATVKRGKLHHRFWLDSAAI